MSVKATGWKYGERWSQEFTTTHEAMRFAFEACTANTLSVMEVKSGTEGTDGETMYGRKAIEAYWASQEWDPEAIWITGAPSES